MNVRENLLVPWEEERNRPTYLVVRAAPWRNDYQGLTCQGVIKACHAWKGETPVLAPSSLQCKGREIHSPARCSHSVLPTGRLCTKVLAKFTAQGHRPPRAGDLGLQRASFAWQRSSPCNSLYFTHHGLLSIRCKIRPGVLVHTYDVHMGAMKIRNPIASLTVCTSGLRPAWAVQGPS